MAALESAKASNEESMMGNRERKEQWNELKTS